MLRNGCCVAHHELQGAFISPSAASLRILLIDPIKDRAARVEEALRGAGHRVTASLDRPADLMQTVEGVNPDVIIFNLGTPDRDTIECLRQTVSLRPRPVVMFVDRSGESMIADAIAAGVTAYVVDGFNARRVNAVLHVAVARFRHSQALASELARTKAKLAERKTIERAKGILMRQKGLSEEEAYNSLRRLAMDHGKPIAELAENIITTAKLFG